MLKYICCGGHHVPHPCLHVRDYPLLCHCTIRYIFGWSIVVKVI